MSWYCGGLDLGQQADYSALVIAEITPTRYERTMTAQEPELGLLAHRGVAVEGLPIKIDVRHMERWALGTPYPAIVRDVRVRMGAVPGGMLLALDQTGVGRGV